MCDNTAGNGGWKGWGRFMGSLRGVWVIGEELSKGCKDLVKSEGSLG